MKAPGFVIAMSRGTLLGMWAVNLARRSFKHSEFTAACVSFACLRDGEGSEGRSRVYSSLLGAGTFGSVLLGGYLWDGYALCEEEKRASAGQTVVRSLALAAVVFLHF